MNGGLIKLKLRNFENNRQVTNKWLTPANLIL